MSVHGHVRHLHGAIQHARAAHPIVPDTPAPPAGVEAPPANAYNPAEYYRQTGHEGYAAQLWMSRHPHAVRNGMIPGWVSRAMAGNVGSALPAPAAPAAPPAPPAPAAGPVPGVPADVSGGFMLPHLPHLSAIGGTPGGQPIGIPGQPGEPIPPGGVPLHQHPNFGSIGGHVPLPIGAPPPQFGGQIHPPGIGPSPQLAAQRALNGYA